MVDLKAVFECPGTQNSALKCGRYSSIYFCSTKVGSLDRAPRTSKPNFAFHSCAGAHLTFIVKLITLRYTYSNCRTAGRYATPAALYLFLHTRRADIGYT